MSITNSKLKSYGQILRSSIILGGAQVCVYGITIAKTKAAAVFLGPSGVGIVSIFQSIVTMVSTVSDLGIAASAVREIALHGQEADPLDRERLVAILRRVSWATGFLGWLMTIVFAHVLSRWSFDTTEWKGEIAILGVALVFGSLASTQSSILQGYRRIGDVARVQVLSSGVSTGIAVALYAWLGSQGILATMISAAVVQWFFSWMFVRRIGLPKLEVDWRATWIGSKRLITLGVAFMWNALTTCAVAFAIRALIVRQLGVEANGIYQAAWGISGMFAGFVLTAMGTDFFPRLSEVANNHKEINRLVNEQTEIGLLLTTPGLLLTLSIAPWLMKIFYTDEFVSAGTMVPWFALGVFVQIISWPLGFIQMAKGASREFIITQTLFNSAHYVLIMIFFAKLGLLGVSVAFPVLYGLYAACMLAYNKRLTGFLWTSEVIRLLVRCTILIVIGLWLGFVGSQFLATTGCILLFGISSIFGLRGLLNRLPENHRLLKLLPVRYRLLLRAK